MRNVTRAFGLILLIASCLALTACAGNVGVGVSVGIPVGNHGHVTVGGWR